MQLGINLPWFHGAYGHDLGPNQAFPDWPVAFDLPLVDELLDILSGFGVRLLRIWLFEQGEGLRYGPNDVVEGVDEVFLRNLERLAEILLRRGFSVYWTLLDGNGPFRNADRTTYRLLTNMRAAEAFCVGALSPTLPLLAQTAWALDLCNEPEGIIRGPFGNGTPDGVEWGQVIPSLSAIAGHVRNRAGRMRLSVGSGFTEQVNLRDNEAFFRFCLGLDFLDYHSYKLSTLVLPRTSCLNTETAHMPVVLGELGCRMAPEARERRSAWRRGQEEISGKLHRLSDLGYEAAFVWFTSEPANRDATSLFFQHEPGRALHTIAKLSARLVQPLAES